MNVGTLKNDTFLFPISGLDKDHTVPRDVWKDPLLHAPYSKAYNIQSDQYDF